MYTSTQDQLGQVPVLSVATQLPSVLGIRLGGHYTGGPFNPDGLQNWANQGHWDYIQQVALTGHGPHWSQPDKYPNGISYAAVDQQAAANFLRLNGPATVTPATTPAAQNPAAAGQTVGTPGATVLKSAAGALPDISTPMLLAGAAVLGIFVYALKGRR